ncbi:MAG: DoxX family protein [Limisphaerales bacterium]
MPLTTPTAPVSRGMFWTGRVITGLVGLVLLFDCTVKLMKAPSAVQGAVQLGYPESTVVPIGMVLLASLAFYIIPRTSILGAILLTGYLGGATATMVRVGSPWILFPVLVGMLVWAGLYFRDDQVRALIPLRR